MAVFDLKKFLVENKITRNSKLREFDDFEFTDTDNDLATNLNAKILKLGDTITPDMWNPDDQDYDYYSKDSWIIEDIYKDEGWTAYIKAKTLTKTIPPWDPSPIRLEQDIDALNNELLKPQYYIEIPDDVHNVNEADDDFEFTDLDKDLANKLSNEVELKIGDTITPDMWGDKQKFINAYYDWFGEEGWFGLKFYNKTIQDSYLIQSMFFAEGDEDFEADWMVSLNSTTTGKSFNIMEESTPLKILNSLLKDNYKIYPSNMNESDDFEFTDTDRDLADKMSSEVELKIGDTVTFDMINPNYDGYKYYSTIVEKDDWIIKDIFEEYNDEYGRYNIVVEIEAKTRIVKYKIKLKSDTDFKHTVRIEISDFNNNFLKPQYYIDTPDDVRKVNEADDDFEFTDTDKNLAIGLSNFPIVIGLINEYTFSDGRDGITVYEVKTTKTNNYELEKILQLGVPHDKESLETLLKDEYFENDDLMEFLNEGKITKAIPNKYYKDGWDNEWEDFDIKVILP